MTTTQSLVLHPQLEYFMKTVLPLVIDDATEVTQTLLTSSGEFCHNDSSVISHFLPVSLFLLDRLIPTKEYTKKLIICGDFNDIRAFVRLQSNPKLKVSNNDYNLDLGQFLPSIRKDGTLGCLTKMFSIGDYDLLENYDPKSDKCSTSPAEVTWEDTIWGRTSNDTPLIVESAGRIIGKLYLQDPATTMLKFRLNNFEDWDFYTDVRC